MFSLFSESPNRLYQVNIIMIKKEYFVIEIVRCTENGDIGHQYVTTKNRNGKTRLYVLSIVLTCNMYRYNKYIYFHPCFRNKYTTRKTDEHSFTDFGSHGLCHHLMHVVFFLNLLFWNHQADFYQTGIGSPQWHLVSNLYPVMPLSNQYDHHVYTYNIEVKLMNH